MARSATLERVAKVAGVSVSTVSRILSSPDFARKETRKSVIGAATKMGYPGLSHELIREGQGGYGLNNVVLLAPEPVAHGSRGLDSPEWIYRGLIPTLQRIAAEKGFQLILASHSQGNPWQAYSPVGGPVGGVLWMGAASDPVVKRIAQTVPIVIVNDESTDPMRFCVMGNNRGVLFTGVRHLMELGHRRIAYFDVDESPAKANIHCRQRLAAYHEAIEYFDLDADAGLCVRERFGFDGHPQAVARAMDRLGALSEKATAVIAPLGYAIQFLKETRSRGMCVPRDLSIVAIDDAHAAEVVDPPLTTIDCSFGRSAEVAIELLLEQRESAPNYARTVLVEPRLIVRQSTAAAGGAA